MTPAGTSNELDVQNEWEENKHTHTCMAINVSVQYNGVFLPDMILLTQFYYHIKCREEVLSLQPIVIHPTKRFDISFP